MSAHRHRRGGRPARRAADKPLRRPRTTERPEQRPDPRPERPRRDSQADAGETSAHRAVEVWFQRRWRRGRGRVISTEPDPYEPERADPDAPTPQSAAILARTRNPIDLDSDDVG